MEAWQSIISIIGELEKSSAKVDGLMKGLEGGFHYKQLKTFRSLTKAMGQKRSAFEKLKNMSFPLSENDVNQLAVTAGIMDALQDAIQEAEDELAAYMKKLNEAEQS